VSHDPASAAHPLDAIKEAAGMNRPGAYFTVNTNTVGAPVDPKKLPARPDSAAMYCRP
jgi:hypothetical protein